MNILNKFKEVMKKSVEESKIFPPEIGKKYILESKDPFQPNIIVIPTEIKGGYVRYSNENINSENLKYSSCEIEVFNRVYKLLQ